MSTALRKTLTLLLCLFLYAAFAPAAFAEEEGTPPVSVFFDCRQPEALIGLSVYNAEGTECPPEELGHYLLAPGAYFYRFHDESGEYEDYEGSFTLGNALKYILPLDLTPAVEIREYAFTYIEPIYADVLTEADIPDFSDGEAVEAELRELATVLNCSPSRRRAKYFWDNNSYYDNVTDAGLELRSQILAFESQATIGISSKTELNTSGLNNLFAQIWAVAVEHDINRPAQGDYLRYEYGGYKVTAYSFVDKLSGNYYYKIELTLYHYTTAAQEAALEPVVNRILRDLALDGKSDYQKLCAIYNYLCGNVRYGGSGDLRFTAYGALVNGLAYCQGYSAAFYRLCLSAGIDARIVTSTAMRHAWNIAALGGRYFALDTTMDATRTPSNYLYYLKGSGYWQTKHRSGGKAELGDQYTKGVFPAQYTMPTYDFPDVLNIPLEAAQTVITDSVSDKPDLIAALAIQSGDAMANLDRVQITFQAASGSNDTEQTVIYTPVPFAAAYAGDTKLTEMALGSARFSGDPRITLTLPVYMSWGGELVNYIHSREGYPDEQGTTTAVVVGERCFAEVSNAAFFARITLTRGSYTVSFETNGGSAVTEQHVITGETAARPADPTRAGLRFAGWYADAALSTVFDFAAPISANTRVYAKWCGAPDLVLPPNVTELGEEAFANGAFVFVQLPDRLLTVGPRAFADCPKLNAVSIPASVSEIDPSAFSGAVGLTVFGQAGSRAASYAAEHGFSFVAIDR